MIVHNPDENYGDEWWVEHVIATIADYETSCSQDDYIRTVGEIVASLSGAVGADGTSGISRGAEGLAETATRMLYREDDMRHLLDRAFEAGGARFTPSTLASLMSTCVALGIGYGTTAGTVYATGAFHGHYEIGDDE